MKVQERRSGQSKMLQGLWAMPLAEALEARGFQANALFRRALIDLDQARVEGVKISSAAFEQVWSMALDVTGDPLLGLDIAEHIHPGTLGSVGYAITASATLSDAFERLRNHQRLLSTTMIVDIERNNQEVALAIQAVDANQSGFRNLGFIAGLMRLLREMSRPDLKPLRVELSLKLPIKERARHGARLEAYFGCPVLALSGTRYRLIFSINDALARLPAANADLAQRLDSVAMQVLGNSSNDSLVGRTRAAIIDKLPGGMPTLKDVAPELHMTPRTLQRRLTEQGASFKDLLDTTRKQLAEGHVRAGEFSQKEIAFLLGYANVSHFSRAFKGWFGHPPGKTQKH